MAARFLQRLRGAVLPALLYCCFAASAHAGSFQLNPLLVEVPQSSAIATYTVRNTGNRPLNLQVSGYRWTQPDDHDKYVPAERLLIVPQILTIQPGREQLVRVALRGAHPTAELEYRLHFNEIPPAPVSGFTGVQTVLHMNVPLFYAPADIVNAYRLRPSQKKDGSVVATVANTGTRFLRIARLRLLNAQGDQVGMRGGPLYVLPGATRAWTVELTDGMSRLPAGKYRLIATVDGKQQVYPLVLR
ncbi:MAG TPA: fimbria/pilus periplasmic chaperone [Gammaproteobacteria bacterium]|nr:fimbria/pilus periplasmic chaperone [Gammaproteobacteria bacterium]